MTERRSARRAVSRDGAQATRVVAAILVILLSFTAAWGFVGCASNGSSQQASSDAGDAEEERPGRIEPRYQPREPEPKPWYNSDYLFGMTRGVTNSTIHPAAQVPLLVLTIPLDIVFLPFAAIGGFF
jgi:hypothetical protein